MFQPALNSVGELVLACANTPREDTYTCLCCGGEMILRKGEILRAHFAHKTLSTCSAESALHKAGKILLSDFLNIYKELTIKKKCRRGCCKSEDFLKLNNAVSVTEEKAFLYRGKRIVPDLAIVDNQTGELLIVLEVFNTHRQKGRPEPWYEFRASSIVDLFLEEHESYVLQDCRQDRKCLRPRVKKKRKPYICGECGKRGFKKRYLNCHHYSCRACYNVKLTGFPCRYCQKPIK